MWRLIYTHRLPPYIYSAWSNEIDWRPIFVAVSSCSSIIWLKILLHLKAWSVHQSQWKCLLHMCGTWAWSVGLTNSDVTRQVGNVLLWSLCARSVGFTVFSHVKIPHLYNFSIISRINKHCITVEAHLLGSLIQ